MKVTGLIAKKPRNNCPIFLQLQNNKDNIYDYTSLNTYRKKWVDINNILINKYVNTLYLYNNYYVSTYFLAEKDKDTFITILFMKTTNALYVNKSIKEHKIAWLRFGATIRKLIKEETLDIIYTDLVGKNIFLTFNPPKFKTIVERKEYGKDILREYEEVKYPTPTAIKEVERAEDVDARNNVTSRVVNILDEW